MNTSGHRTGRAWLLSLLLGAAAQASFAHTYVLNIGEAASATHYFGVICSNEGGYDTDHLYVQIQTNTANAPLLSAQIIKGTVATSTTDPISGDAVASPPMRHHGGNGLYQVLVNKTGAGAAVFTITAHCLDVTGTQHTGTDAVVYQYQDH